VDIERLASIAVDCGFQVHKGLGPELLESAYQAVLVELLQRSGLQVEVEVVIPITFGGDHYRQGI
jgi:iron complex transport system substrate-binding protein